MSRNRIRGLAKLVLGAFLFAQAAVALADCNWGERAPAQVIVTMGEMPCCPNSEAPDVLPGNTNEAKHENLRVRCAPAGYRHKKTIVP